MFDDKKIDGPVGRYDLLVTLAERYQWTPEQVLRMDPDFVDEIVIRCRADADDRAMRKRRGKQKGRRRPTTAAGDNLVVEDADVGEIT